MTSSLSAFSLKFPARLAAILTLCACACASAETEVGGGGSGSGARGGAGGFSVDFDNTRPGAGATSGGGPHNAETCGQLGAIIRDFSDKHIDFENLDYDLGLTRGLVKSTLDADGKPVYAHNKPTLITNQETFAKWYRDIEGTNMRFVIVLPMQETSPGVYVYENNAFFPIDDQGFGNEMRNHNFHFTTEIRGGFVYRGGKKFTFKGDDDVWVSSTASWRWIWAAFTA